ncbi:fluoride efflux transporter CrcB [Fodinicola acaciae]|uniref:fluoride efflux transporter CrcB n=1 Tax=Fodinicola acaciae TaxID=2681555 RepID=UPI001FE2598B|nr:fluoride efflux transporter CrcB [Fodinicola acaciae]
MSSEVGDVDVNRPVDPDIDVRVDSQRGELVRSHGAVLLAISLGGGVGAVARHAVSQLLPTTPGQVPWGTLTINVVGCLLIGVLMVLITEVWSAHRLLRPFLGVGVLGGFTTFSTYAVEIRALLQPDTVGIAFAYLAGTLIGALLAVIAGVWVTRAVTTWAGLYGGRR